MTVKTIGLCDLCNQQGVPVRAALVRWVNPMFGEYEHVDRCLDVEACKDRVASNGDRWPVVDAKP